MIVWQFVQNQRDSLIAQGVLTEAELDELAAAVKHHMEDPATLVMSHLYIQFWGRKPTGESLPYVALSGLACRSLWRSLVKRW